jgi:hypothetical protein
VNVKIRYFPSTFGFGSGLPNNPKSSNVGRRRIMPSQARWWIILALLGTHLTALEPQNLERSSHFPFGFYRYDTQQLRLGISFPPLNGEEQLQFTFERMDELSMDRLRFDIHWNWIEVTRGNRQWSALQSRLTLLNERGFRLFCTIDLKFFPEWFFLLNEQDQRDAFQAFIQDLLGRFGDQIHFLQLGNEWNWEVAAHFQGRLDQFITLAALLAKTTETLPDPRPEIVLGSLSIGGLQALAFAQNRIDNVFFAGKPLYRQEDLAAFDKETFLEEVHQVFGGIPFDVIDLHFYADFWMWGTYLEAVKQVLREAGIAEEMPVIASEFGGPHPLMESLRQETQAHRTVSYVHTLDQLGIQEAYFFKLVQNPTQEQEFWNSYLFDLQLSPTLAYEVLRRFGEASSAVTALHEP